MHGEKLEMTRTTNSFLSLARHPTHCDIDCVSAVDNLGKFRNDANLSPEPESV